MKSVESDADKLAGEPTRLAYERTMLSWVRTSLSLITFGFTIYKFFDYLRESREGAFPPRLVGPRGFGIMMICIGLIALLLATIQHRRSMKLLRAVYPETPVSLAAVLAGLISIMGLAALAAAVFRQ